MRLTGGFKASRNTAIQSVIFTDVFQNVHYDIAHVNNNVHANVSRAVPTSRTTTCKADRVSQTTHTVSWNVDPQLPASTEVQIRRSGASRQCCGQGRSSLLLCHLDPGMTVAMRRISSHLMLKRIRGLVLCTLFSPLKRMFRRYGWCRARYLRNPPYTIFEPLVLRSGRKSLVFASCDHPCRGAAAGTSFISLATQAWNEPVRRKIGDCPHQHPPHVELSRLFWRGEV